MNAPEPIQWIWRDGSQRNRPFVLWCNWNVLTNCLRGRSSSTRVPQDREWTGGHTQESDHFAFKVVPSMAQRKGVVHMGVLAYMTTRRTYSSSCYLQTTCLKTFSQWQSNFKKFSRSDGYLVSSLRNLTVFSTKTQSRTNGSRLSREPWEEGGGFRRPVRTRPP